MVKIHMRILAVGLIVFFAARAGAAEPMKIAVMPAKYAKSATKAVEHEVFDEAMLAAVQGSGSFAVIGKSDMDSVLGFDKQRQALGCTDTACFAEIGGALGVNRIIDVQVAKTDKTWMINAKLIDIKSPTPQVIARVSDTNARGGSDVLMAALPAVVQRLLQGQPGSHPPSAIAMQQTATSSYSPPAASPTPSSAAVSPAPLPQPTEKVDPRLECSDAQPKNCTSVGRAYFLGVGVAKDAARAASFYQRSCDHGDPRGCLYLALMYGEGNGVPQNAKREVELYRRACQGGDGAGCVALAVEYEFGGGPIPRDLKRAEEFYQRACTLGEKRGCDEGGRLRRGW